MASSSTAPLIELENLTKRYGSITAVDGVDLAVARGEVIGFLGPNGAGKSTTMKLVTGYLAPSSGTARVAGFDVVAHPREVKRRIGYLPEGAPLYGEMTPQSLLTFVARVRRLPRAERSRVIGSAIEKLRLAEVLHQPIDTLSKGFKRRVGLAQAILMDPEILILDEPTDGLDPNQKHEVRALLREMAGEKAVIVSTHILEEVEAVCSRVVLIADGRVVADESPLALAARAENHNRISLRLARAHMDKAKTVLRALPGVKHVEASGNDEGEAVLRISGPGVNRDMRDTARKAIAAAGLETLEISRERGRLDDVFRAMTMTGASGGGSGAGGT